MSAPSPSPCRGSRPWYSTCEHVSILTSAEALVTLEGVGPLLAECLDKKVVLTEIPPFHLSAAILFLAADIVTT